MTKATTENLRRKNDFVLQLIGKYEWKGSDWLHPILIDVSKAAFAYLVFLEFSTMFDTSLIIETLLRKVSTDCI